MFQRTPHSDPFSFFFAPIDEGEPREFTHPRGELANATFAFDQGASRVRLAGDPNLDFLFRARSEGPAPEVDVYGSRVTVRHRHSVAQWIRYALLWGRHGMGVSLNTKVGWDLAFRGGLTYLDADLRQVKLQGLEVLGGASHLYLKMPRPKVRVPVRIYGGATHVVMRCPKNAPFRVRIRGGATHLEVDENVFGAIGGPLQWASPDFDGADGRFDIEVMGGASHVSIRFDEEVVDASEPAPTPSVGA